MSDPPTPEEQREQLLDSWEHVAAGWGRQADRNRQIGMPVSAWMIDHAELHPGQRVLELAAGPGDTGFLAAELVLPGGTLVCSDGSEAMLEVARERAQEQEITNVEFAQLQLEWIDLPAASVDVVLCRWGVMLCVDPEAALRECRRVLRPGGRLVLAVWDLPAANPWVTIPQAALVELGLAEPVPPTGPGMFALAAPGQLAELLEQAGFGEVTVEPVAIERPYDSPLAWIGEMVDCSRVFGSVWRTLADDRRRALREEVEDRARAFATAAGGLVVPGRCLAAVAEA